jgi:hypothetical protein
LTVQVTGTTDTSVSWTVNGIPGGSVEAGQICVLGSNPCQLVATASATQVDYIAPAAMPASNPVTVRAVSTVDANAFATSEIAVINHVIVSVLPNNVTLPPLGVQQFTATVLGTDDQNGTWQVQGSGCTGAGICGGITSAGLYTAPGAAPNPDALQVVAVSVDVGATVGGWSCSDPGPTQFDATYALERLAIGHNYQLYAEPLNGVVDASQISNATSTLCRNSTTDPGWPALQNCVVPAVEISITTRTRPGP